MKAETAISDLLMKCEEQGVQLPENPWQALRETISALRNTKHHALGYLQIPKAIDHLKTKFSAAEAKQVAAASSPRLVRRQKRTLMQDMPSKRNRRNMIPESDSDSDEDSSNQAGVVSAMSPMASSKKTKYQKKSRLQEQVEALPAARDENQPLVDQLVQLGEYEMHHGHSQRGLSRFRAAKEIRDSRVVITSGAQAKQLERVGAAVATKVDQILNEGLAAALGEYEGDGEALPVAKQLSTTPKRSAASQSSELASSAASVSFTISGTRTKKMNRRQAQRSLAELISKCEAAHIQLPEDPLEARAEAVEAIIHSLKDGKASLGDAQDELQQKYGLDAVWKQYMENEEAKRLRRRQSHTKKVPVRAKDPRRSKNLGSPTEPPSLGDEMETEVGEKRQHESHDHKSIRARVSVMTPSKRAVASQELAGEMKIAKKAKSARGLIVSGASDDAERNPFSSEKKSGTGLGNILSSDPESPDQGIVDLLGLEDLGDPDGDDDMSSDGEFAL